jgi:dipeptidyl aminopeptidase/acylaminoacyl peptidase
MAPARLAADPLNLDDVLALERIDRAVLSPDGQTAAVVVQRGAGPDEVYGRGLYQLDPGRGDIWLVSLKTGERRNLTHGAAFAAGYWCATWSPDGRKLALLSTEARGSEPRGGDNVRLYVWDSASNALSRLSDDGVMSQSVGGSPMGRVDLRGGHGGGSETHRCSAEQTAPFAWLDDRRLLAIMLPAGTKAALIDALERPARHTETVRAEIRAGRRPTVTASGSGVERTVADPAADMAQVRVFDLGAASSAAIAALPTYPFRGDLSIAIAPDLRRIAVMATVGTIAADQRGQAGSGDPAWTVEKRLGFAELEPNAPLRWLRESADSRYPLELYGWSPDSRRVAFRARPDARTTTTPLFVADAAGGVATWAGAPGESVGGDGASSEAWHEPDALWLDERRLLARLSGPRGDWWLVEADGKGSVNLTQDIAAPPAQFRRVAQGALLGLAGDRLLRLSSTASRLETVSTDPMLASEALLWPAAGGVAGSSLVVASRAADGGQRLRRLSAQDGRSLAKPLAIPAKAQLLDSNGEALLWLLPKRDGLFLQRTSFREGRSQDLLALNRNLGRVRWGRTLLIDYEGLDGQPLKGAVILPPGYTSERKYPVIAWVYAGYQVRDLDDYWLDPYLPAFYNLQLYAAKDYIVLIPSMPLSRSGPKSDLFLELPKGVLPAVDRLVALGLADPDRIGLMGQSRGGYSVYGLVTQTRRFKAAVAMSGFTDLAAMALQFDPAARGYPGIEHEKSDNWWIVGQWGLPPDPSDDYARYWRNSPLAYVDRVDTPLLLIHGEYDIRDPLGQADAFFSALYDKGKTARLLRYWGEDHGLSESPANVRNIFEETVRWFDKYLAAQPEAASSGADANRHGGG